MKQAEFTLNNDVRIPAIGFGTYRIPAGAATEKAVADALAAGYRHIDGAAVYGNEHSVGRAIRRSGIPREEIFVTSKLWNAYKGFEQTLAAFERTITDLQLDYLDLYLIHTPIARATRNNWQQANSESWRAFEQLYRQGRIRSIGVSNFLPHHMEALMQTATVQPMVNQIEFLPGMLQPETVAFCKRHNILIESWGPFANGYILGDLRLVSVAEKYGKSTAQIILRWIFQKGIVSLPKSVTVERMRSNLDIFDFELAAGDSLLLDSITDAPNSGFHPDKIFM